MSLMALNGHTRRAGECPLSGVKRTKNAAKQTLANRCSPILIYEFTA